MNSQRKTSPLFLHTAFVATATGVVGLIVSTYGVALVSSSGNAQLRDTLPIVDSTMMSICSLTFILAAIFAIAHSARGRAFTWSHGLVVFVAGLVTQAVGIDGAYPR